MRTYGKFPLLTRALFASLCTLILLAAGHTAQAQGTAIDIDFRGASFTTVAKYLEREYGFDFTYRTDDLTDLRPITISEKNASIAKVMNACLQGSGLEFEVRGKSVIIRRSANPQQQSATYTGRVTDDRGQPMAGVSVLIKGAPNRGTLTDARGNFSIRAATPPVLQFSFVGYHTEEADMRNRASVDITLSESLTQIDQVMITTGLQTMKPNEYAAAYSRTTADSIMQNNAPSIDQMLQGRLPGLMTENTSGEPGAAPKIRIRGNATINGNKSPLWIVDGVIMESSVPFTASDINSEDAAYLIGSAISGINPHDIESITVLKDAAATAIYGVRAANGVIVLTTKRGHRGEPQITYSGTVSLNTRPDYRYYDRMNASQRIQLSREIIDEGIPYNTVPVGDSYEGYYNLFMNKKITAGEFNARVIEMQQRNTDWFAELFRPEVSQNHTATVSGGNNRSSYYFSGSYYNNYGAAIGSQSERFTALSKLDFQPTRWLDVQLKIDYSSTANDGFRSGVNPFNYAYNTSRTVPAYETDGSYHFYTDGVGYKYNFIHEREETGMSAKMDNFNGLAALRVKILDGFSYNGTFSLARGNTGQREWATEYSNAITKIRRYEYGVYDETSPQYTDSRLPYGGILKMDNIRRTGYTVRNTLNYARTICRVHDINAMAGMEVNSKQYVGQTVTGYGWSPRFGETFMPVYTSRFVSEDVIPGHTTPEITNSVTQIASFFATLAYTYDNRYVFNANIRSDGSNKFGSDPRYRWLPTWSVAGKWIVSNERFMRDSKIFNSLMFRGSYGLQGNIHDDATPNLIARYSKRDNVSGLDAYSIYRLPNPSLRWEKTSSWNAAVDFALLDNRLRGSFDVYRKNTTDLLTNKTIPTSTGRSSVMINSAEMYNAGFEGFLNVEIIRKRDLNWRVGVNFSRNINKITLANIDDVYSSQEIVTMMLAGTLAVAGAPIGSIYSYRYAGLSSETGQPMFYSKVAGKEKVYYGVPELMELENSGTIFPDLTGGFDTQVTYRRISLALAFTYSMGAVKRLPSAYENSLYAYNPQQNVSTNLIGRWKKPGDENNTDIPSMYNRPIMNKYLQAGQYTASPEGFVSGTQYPYQLYDRSNERIGKADFLKLKSITLSYNMPSDVARKIYMANLNMRLQVVNVFSVMSGKWKGLDPESSNANIPLLPVYSFALDFTF